MAILPTPLDLWLAHQLVGFIPSHPRFAVGVQDAIRVGVLGGLWFGLARFVGWNQSSRGKDQMVQLRILTILLGSGLAILLTLFAGAMISWPPPVHYPGLNKLFLGYLGPNPNTNSFPSQSVAVFGAVAAGMYSLHKTVGWALWTLVVLFIAFPRMFVGGHFFTDVVVGFLLALIGYWLARDVLEARVTSRLERFLDQTSRLQLLREILVFFWIIQVTVEFQGVVWVKDIVEPIFR
jgi:membrane-associated phospholipid phosphatase